MEHEPDQLLEAKYQVLSACGDQQATGGNLSVYSHLLPQHTYRRIARLLDQDARIALVDWLEGAGIDVVVPAERIALYHAAPGRQYRPSKRERESGRYECPACHIILVRVTRKAKDPLFRCQDCGWSIARSDIFDPEPGETPELRDDVMYPEGIVGDPW